MNVRFILKSTRSVPTPCAAPVLVLRVARSPGPVFLGSLRQVVRTCDPAARIVVLATSTRSRTVPALHGDWACPPGQVLSALSLLFSISASAHV